MNIELFKKIKYNSLVNKYLQGKLLSYKESEFIRLNCPCYTCIYNDKAKDMVFDMCNKEEQKHFPGVYTTIIFQSKDNFKKILNCKYYKKINGEVN